MRTVLKLSSVTSRIGAVVGKLTVEGLPSEIQLRILRIEIALLSFNKFGC